MANKGNIQPISNKFYNITAGDIMNYLENDVLGFRVDGDFTRWTGITPAHSYVRMRVVIQARDIVVNPSTLANDYALRILNENQKGYDLDKRVVDSLKPFMYPEDFDYRSMSPEVIRHLNEIGVIGTKVDEIARFSKLTMVQDPNNPNKRFFRVYLRPERIISEILSDTVTGKPEGELFIRRVTGETSSEFRWLVEEVISSPNIISSDLNIDQIFAMKN
jgi:hypothetical protein